MGNAFDCNKCNNNGWKREAGCPACKRGDTRPAREAEYDRTMRQYEINQEVATRLASGAADGTAPSR